METSLISSVKALADSSIFSLPSTYYETLPSCYEKTLNNPTEQEDSIPVIDFSLLTSADPEQRSKVVQDIGKACREWQGFMVYIYIYTYFCLHAVYIPS